MSLSSLLSPIFTSRPVSDQSAFEDYIRAAIPTLTTTAYWPSNNTIQCFFSTQLSSSDQTLLLSKIAAYSNPVYVSPGSYYYSPTGMSSQTSNNLSWTTAMTFSYKGQLSPYQGTLTSFKLRSYLVPSIINDSGSGNFYYDVQVIDDANTVWASARYSNSSEATNSMTVASAPMAPCFLRLQVKKGLAGAYIQLTALCLQYDT